MLVMIPNNHLISIVFQTSFIYSIALLRRLDLCSISINEYSPKAFNSYGLKSTEEFIIRDAGLPDVTYTHE